MTRVALALLASGCALPTTQLVLVADTDQPVPSVVREIKITLEGPTGGTLPPVYATFDTGSGRTPIMLPATLGITPRADPSESVTITVATFFDGGDRISRTVRTGFVADETRLVFVTLEGACRGPMTMMQCPLEQTCAGGTCIGIDVPPDTLPRCEGDVEQCIARGP
jgi:hypothetical protein